MDAERNERLLRQMKERAPEWAQNLLIAGVRGSDAHGTRLEEGDRHATDDIDVFGVAVKDVETYLGLPYHPNTQQTFGTAGETLDILIYDIRKFFHLLVKGNPNVHAWLWADPSDRFLRSVPADWLLDHREVFISQHCLNALHGYATAQFHKMKGGEYQGYMGERRKALKDEYGYDIKNAAHCVRLLWLGIELASQGTMYSRRPRTEAEVLKAIKRGTWALDDVLGLVETLKHDLRGLEARKTLPPEVDREAVNTLLVETMGYR